MQKIIAYKLSSENSFYSKCKILGSSQGINQEILVAMPVLRLGLAVVIWCDLLSFNQSGYDGFCTVAGPIGIPAQPSNLFAFAVQDDRDWQPQDSHFSR